MSLRAEEESVTEWGTDGRFYIFFIVKVGLATHSCSQIRVRVFMKTHALKCVCKRVRREL